MFGWFKKKPSPAEPIAHQPPHEIFPWPVGVTITAVDDVVIALPLALFDQDRPMGEFLFGPDGMGIKYLPDKDFFLIHLEPGMAVRLAKSCQAFVVADDGKPRRLKPSGPGVRTTG